MVTRKGKIDRSFFDDVLGEVEAAGAPPPTAEVSLDRITPRADQFRRTFDPAGIEALTASIGELGLLEPIVVRPQGSGFEIVAGERRYRALRQLGWERAPVRVVAFDDAQAELAGAVENLNREDLTPLEEVDAVLSVLQHALGTPRDEVIASITRVRTLELEGRSLPEDAVPISRLFKSLGYTSVNSFYANRLSLLRYPGDLLQAMREQGLAYTKARLLARLKDAEARRDLLGRVLEADLSVEALERQVRSLLETARASPGLYSDLSRIKRLVTQRRVERLDTAAQKRLRQLMKEMEKLLATHT